MTLESVSNVGPRALAAFQRLLGASLIAKVVTDIHAGIWRVHTGELFPWRHLPGFPLYSPMWLTLEWALCAVSGVLLLLLKREKIALSLAMVAVSMGLSQRYSNQQALLLIVLGFSLLGCSTRDALLREPGPRLELGLLRVQLVIVYLFSAINKIVAGFLDGHSLATLLGLPSAVAVGLSWLVVLAELALPGLLGLGWRRTAVVGAIGLHTAFAALMPGLLPFSLLMVALAALWSQDGEPARRSQGATSLGGTAQTV